MKKLLSGVIILIGTPALHALTMNDSSKLHAKEVQRIEQPASIKELQMLVKSAQKNKQKIMVSGLRRSQGDHISSTNCIMIDMTRLNKILAVDPVAKTVTAQAGATWKDVQEAINQYRLSVKVMQGQNTFTLGGSISADARGLDWHYGGIGNTLISFDLLRADGTIITVTKATNLELFKLVVGGYGLFGIITKATFALTEDVALASEVSIISPKKYAASFAKNTKGNPNAVFHTGVVAEGPFHQIVAWTCTKTSAKKDSLFTLVTEVEPGAVWEADTTTGKVYVPLLKTATVKMYKHSPFIRYASSIPGSFLFAKTHGLTTLSGMISRNNMMRESGIAFKHESTKRTDLIQEYFIPAEHLSSFLTTLKKEFAHNKLKMLYTFTRFIPKNDASFLSPTPNECFSVIILFSASLDAHQYPGIVTSMRYLIGAALAVGGTYNLGYKPFATHHQLLTAYPQITTFFEKKRAYDPHELFVSGFYLQYKGL